MMQEGDARTVVRVLGALMALAFTATVAFVAGVAVSMLLSRDTAALPEPVPSPLPGATPTEPVPVTPPTPSTPDEETFQLFWEVWTIVQREYYGELPDMRAVTYGAIRGMLTTLGDDYTSFIEPEIAAILQEDSSGSFQGIGAFVRMRDDGNLEIVGIIAGSPAEDAGLQDGDLVLAVDGQSIVGYGIYEAIALIRGPAGTEVTLLVERSGVEEPFAVALTRAEVAIPLVEAEMLEGNVAYVRLTEFSSTASDRLEEALDELLAQGPVGLIFDLRDNPGGWLDQAVQVADLFLDEGIVLIERSSDGSEHVYRSQDGDLAEQIPLVVLVNDGSASASEIVAGAIRDRGRGVLIGLPTFGKGSVQRPYALSDGSELRVTIAHWFLPSDTALHGQGLTPDIEVPLPDDLEPGEDPQLERAQEFLLSGE